MSQEIDQRIVEMQFDNKQFESGVADSMSTLKKLKKALRLDKASKGLDELSSSVRSVKMDPLASAVQVVSDRFSALGVAGMVAMQRITNSVMDCGKRLISAITIDPIRSGFQEYETQINAIQTILANTSSKGTSLDQVNTALDELNHYADLTIYNFTEMTRNIGTFTAAGVDLDTSVAAIKGIANLAAVSGSTSQQASTAMYQLSQALASGTVKLQDWNSVVNAGMGGEVFQNALKETARLRGVKIDSLIQKYGSFRETLSKGWLTSEILTETLQKFTGDLSKEQLAQMGYTKEQAESIYEMGQTANDAATKVKTITQLFDTLKEALQSGWTQSWEWIIGDFDQAKELLTAVSDVLSDAINRSAEERNRLLEGWSGGGGRYMMIGGFREFARGLTAIGSSIQSAWSNVFPELTVKKMLQFSGKFRTTMIEFHKALEKPRGEDGQSILDYVQSAFKGVFSVVKAGLRVVKAFGGIVMGGLRALAPLGMKVVQALGDAGDWLHDIFEQATGVESLSALGKNIAPVFELFANALSKLWDKGVEIGQKVFNGETFKNLISTFSGFFGSITKAIPGTVQKIQTFLSMLWQSIQTSQTFQKWSAKLQGFLQALGAWFSKFKDKAAAKFAQLKQMLEDGTFPSPSELVRQIAEKLGLDKLWQSLSNSPVIKQLSKGFQRFADVISNTFSKLMSALRSILPTASASDGTQDKKGLFADFGEWLSSSVTWLGQQLAQIKAWFSGVFNGFINWLSNINFGKIIGIASGLAGVFALLKTGMALRGIGKTFKEIGELLKDIRRGGLKKLLGKNGGDETTAFDKLGANLLKIAGAIAAVVGIMYVLSKMDGQTIKDGLVRLAIVMAELGAFAVLMEKFGPKHAGAQLLMLAGALTLMLVPLTVLSRMSAEDFGSGLLKLGEIMLVLALFMRSVNGQGMAGKSGSLLALAIAINLLILPIKALARMPLGSLAQGIIAVSIAMLAIAGAARLAGGTKGGSGRLLALAIALNLLIVPIKVFASMDLGTLAQGVGGLVAVLLGLAVFFRLAGKMNGKAAGGLVIAMAAVSGFILLFSECLKSIQTIPTATIAAFGGSLTAMMLSITGAIAVLGRLSIGQIIKGAAAIGVGIIVLGAALSLVGGIVSSAFASVATNMGTAVTALKMTSDTAGGIKQKNIEKAATAFETLAGLMTSTFGGNVKGSAQFGKISEQIVTLGSRLGFFNTLVTDLDTANSSKAKIFAEDIVAAIGAFESIQGVSDKAEALAIGIANIGAAVRLYNENLGNRTLPTDASSNAQNIGAFITELSKALPSADVLQRIDALAQSDGTNLTSKSLGIVNLAASLSDYGDVAAGINVHKMNNVTDALDQLIGVRDKLGTDGDGILAYFTGRKTNFETFGTEIYSLGRALRDFYASVSYVDLSGVGGGFEKVDADSANGAVAIAEKLVGLNTYLKENRSFLDLFFGDNSLSQFGTNVAWLGQCLGNFVSETSKLSINDDITSSIIGVLSTLADIQNSLEMPQVLHSGITTQNFTIDKLAEWLKKSASDIKTAAENFGETDTTKIQSVITAIKDLAYAMNILSPENIDGGKLTNLLTVMASTTIPEFNTSGAEAAQAFFASFITESQNGLAEVKTLGITIAGALNSQYSIWYDAGANAASGFAVGIGMNRSQAINAAIKLAADSLSAAKKRLDIHSPSRETAEMGRYFSLGLAQGIDNYAHIAEYSAGSMSQEALDAVKQELAALASVPLDNLDIAPVIRPVIDLSEVNAGVSTIGGMMQMRPMIPVGSIASGLTTDNLEAIAGRYAAGSNTDFAAEIRSVNAKLDELSSQLANMKVVLDSGELVGGIQSKMDTALGRNAKMRERS